MRGEILGFERRRRWSDDEKIWAYVRDQRPWAGASPPGAVYRFAPNWKEEHVLSHLAGAHGILQADGYKGYAKLYAPDHDGRHANTEHLENATYMTFKILTHTDQPLAGTNEK
jgi:hypothetical protein